MQLALPSGLCADCKKQNIIYALLEGIEIPYYRLPTLLSWIPNRCHLCDFLVSCSPAGYFLAGLSETGPSLGVGFLHRLNLDGIKLRSAHVEPRLRQGYKYIDITYDPSYGFAKTQRSYRQIVCIPSDEWKAYQPTKAKVNLEVVAGWLKQKNTDYECAQKQAVAQEENGVPLTVIDCITRNLIDLPDGEHYITLSYVWGSKSIEDVITEGKRQISRIGSLFRLSARAKHQSKKVDDDAGSATLQQKVPLTIEDSIQFCKALNIRYLWVDRYCIPQNDHHIRSWQIAHMNEIYRNAYLTIVACAGSTPDHGLPGVSKPRFLSPAVNIGKFGYLQLLPTTSDIDSSIWATRAWTYQEALLSSRLLYFTEKQVYYQSPGRIRSEMSASEEDWTGEWEASVYGESLSFTTLGRWDIYDCISQYSHRKMAYESDVLNALLGILAFYHHNRAIRHLWGIPYSVGTPASKRKPSTNQRSFEDSLRWGTEDGEPLSHRKGFPSWSWAAWQGGISWEIMIPSDLGTTPNASDLPIELKTESGSGTIDAKIELVSGRLVKWEDFQQKYAEWDDYSRRGPLSDDTNHLSVYVHLEAFVSPIMRFQFDHRSGRSKVAVRSRAEESLYFRVASETDFPKTLSENKRIPLSSLLVLHFTRPEGPAYDAMTDLQFAKYDHPVCALLIRNIGDHWVRMALLLDATGQFRHAERFRKTIRLG